MPAPGALNLITDVDGLRVGHATDERARSGVTTLLCGPGMNAAVDVRGGGPGTRETEHVSLMHNLRVAMQVVPDLAKLRMVRSWAGYEGVASDALPLFGENSSDYSKEFWHAKLAPYVVKSTQANVQFNVTDIYTNEVRSCPGGGYGTVPYGKANSGIGSRGRSRCRDSDIERRSPDWPAIETPRHLPGSDSARSGQRPRRPDQPHHPRRLRRQARWLSPRAFRRDCPAVRG